VIHSHHITDTIEDKLNSCRFDNINSEAHDTNADSAEGDDLSNEKNLSRGGDSLPTT
jgi:hypothetical protein